MSDFKNGEIVYLASGGPAMMVVDNSPFGGVMVTYANDEGQMVRQGFQSVCLTTTDPRAPRTVADTLRLIDQWGRDRNIIGGGASKDQFIKLVSEIAELGDKGINKRNLDEIKDGIGDAIVVLCMIAGIERVSVADCIDIAYEEIKDRTGVLFEGAFVKSTDPQYEEVVRQIEAERAGMPLVKGFMLDGIKLKEGEARFHHLPDGTYVVRNLGHRSPDERLSLDQMFDDGLTLEADQLVPTAFVDTNDAAKRAS